MSFASAAIDAIGRRVSRLPAARRSLAGRMTGWYVLTSTLIALLTSAWLFFTMHAAINWVDDQILIARQYTIRALLLEDSDGQLWINHEASEDMAGPRRIFIRTISAEGAVTHESWQMAQRASPARFPDVSADPLGQVERATITSDDGQRYRVLAVRARARTDQGYSFATIQIAADTTLDSVAIVRFERALFVTLAASVLLCAAVGVRVIRRGLTPIAAITSAVTATGTDTLNRRLNPDEFPTELQALGRQFNEMLARLETAYRGLRQYADNVAHELRTPLNQLMIESGVALSTARTADEYRDALEQNAEDCARMSVIVERLLFLARAENRQTALEIETLDLGRELEAVRSYYEAIANDASVTLRVTAPAALTMDADRALLQRAITNLVSNALTYTPAGGAVTISAAPVDGGVDIVVADTGAGIAPEHLPHIFDRFYRADAIRSSGDDHLGLGLAITKGIVELHDGKVTLDSVVGSGTKIHLFFPRKEMSQTV